MKIKTATLSDLRTKFLKSEGVVLLGCGGDLQDWVEGVSSVLLKDGITQTGSPEDLWAGAYQLNTTGGRIDLFLPFSPTAKFAMGRMAVWRLQFGECSWWSDYMTNYASQHVGGELTTDDSWDEGNDPDVPSPFRWGESGENSVGRARQMLGENKINPTWDEKIGEYDSDYESGKGSGDTDDERDEPDTSRWGESRNRDVAVRLIEGNKMTKVSPFLDNFTTSVFGRSRSKSISTSNCVSCGKPANEFRDQLSEREYRISGLCQKCQDSVFG